jgi:hypothetical protein
LRTRRLPCAPNGRFGFGILPPLYSLLHPVVRDSPPSLRLVGPSGRSMIGFRLCAIASIADSRLLLFGLFQPVLLLAPCHPDNLPFASLLAAGPRTLSFPFGAALRPGTFLTGSCPSWSRLKLLAARLAPFGSLPHFLSPRRTERTRVEPYG